MTSDKQPGQHRNTNIKVDDMRAHNLEHPKVIEFPDPLMAPYQPVLLQNYRNSVLNPDQNKYLNEIPGIEDMNKLLIDISGEETIERM